MKRLLVPRTKKIGLPPGTLVYLSDSVEPKENVLITIFDFNEDYYNEKQNALVEDCVQPKNGFIRWINVDGVHDLEIIEKICTQFKVHSLTQEDIVNTEQRPKVDEYSEENYLYFVIKMLYLKKEKLNNGEEHSNETLKLQAEQISLILGKNYVISFQETIGDIFDPIRTRIRAGKGKIRKKGSDYLTYLLIDSVIDNYFLVLEKIGENIEKLEDLLIKNEESFSINEIYNFKREILVLRKSTWPMKELMLELETSDYANQFFEEKTLLYMRDIYDHIMEVIESIEIYREILAELVNQNISLETKKANDVMKVLTVIATIFIPLTFISSVYGMNFKYMPELAYDWFYPLLWLFYILISIIMIIFFRKKHWF